MIKRDKAMFTVRYFPDVLFRVALLFVVLVSVAGAREKVILDTDMVVLYDDGVAMMMLANHPDIELLGVTIVPGNTWLAEGTAYALRQLEVLNRPDIPVAAGILYLAFGRSGVPAVLNFILGNYGFLNPILAAAAMAASSVTVVSNSLRLKRFRPVRLRN